MCRAYLKLVLLIALIGHGLAAASPVDNEKLSGDDEKRKGQRIYRDGMLPSGAPLQASVQQTVALSGSDAACAKCHRRSGLGSSEGQQTIRPIAGRLLFSSPEISGSQRVNALFRVKEARTPYTLDSLARALRDGIDADGRKLDPLMPRFVLGDADIALLAGYLKGLSLAPSPGVTESEIHFATIIAPGVAPERSQAMLDVLHAFFRDKNGGTRQESRRKAVGTEQMYRVYRKWVLHEWRLSGPPESWQEQLEAHYGQQPVFAVLSGIGAGSWRPVHEFCERSEIPCVFPNVDYPELVQKGHATLYFSRGVALEAEVLAKHLLQSLSGSSGRIVQVFRDTGEGRLPAQVLRTALQRNGISDVTDKPLADGQPVPEDFWAQLLRDTQSHVLVLWLNDEDVANLPSRETAQSGIERIYLSGSLVGQAFNSSLSDSWQERLHLVYPFELSERRVQRLSRMKHWLLARNIALREERAQAGAYFAATIAGDALAAMGENFSRDYFIERVEQMTENSLSSATYPRLSLGDGQRFASRGAYIAKLTGDGEKMLLPASEWIVP